MGAHATSSRRPAIKVAPIAAFSAEYNAAARGLGALFLLVDGYCWYICTQPWAVFLLVGAVLALELSLLSFELLESKVSQRPQTVLTRANGA